MTPDQYCADKAEQSGSSFVAAFRFLPDDKRRAMLALYAFCREVDDVVDETSDENVARTTLNWWRADIALAYEGQPQHPVNQALQPVVRAFDLPLPLLLELIDGMEMDLNQARYATFADLRQYCYRVASVVGLLSARIFGFHNAQTLAYAEDLGIAFQLTNIIRDIGEDARRGRIYLPVEDLQRFQVPAEDILQCRETEAVRSLLEFQIERAEQYYGAAFAKLPDEDRKAQRPGLVMAAIYRTVLREIRAEGAQKALNQRLSLGKARKIWLSWKTWITAAVPV